MGQLFLLIIATLLILYECRRVGGAIAEPTMTAANDPCWRMVGCVALHPPYNFGAVPPGHRYVWHGSGYRRIQRHHQFSDTLISKGCLLPKIRYNQKNFLEKEEKA